LEGAHSVTEKETRTGLLDVLTWRFFINYAVILGLTCWIPLTAARAVMSDTEGNVIREMETKTPLYESWKRIGTGVYAHITDAAEKPSRKALQPHFLACGMHLLICFLISWWVWFMVLRARDKKADGAPEENGKDAAETDAPDGGSGAA
jgi:hypothetical protein